ncbi:MAG: DUF2791 family P-loop domain-containing protein [Candidatus Methanomethylophilaceae archaeon]|nr:DUF2791 family P-loop domain-containing protein [Candidatus Methanomethylophilaceae archaeon]
MGTKVGRKSANIIIKALSSGVVPSRGAEQIAVGRKEEVLSFDRDLQDVSDGIGVFRFIVGDYGTGKTFLSQLVRTHAADAGFVVMSADLSPARRLRGSGGEGIMTYRQLVSSMSVKGMMDGGALEAVLQTWMENLRNRAAERTGQDPASVPVREVEDLIRRETEPMAYLPFYNDFKKVLVKYYVRMRVGRDTSDQIRWLNGDCTSLKEAKDALEVGSCVKDDNWFEFVKMWAALSAVAGYKGLVVILDQADVLTKIGSAARTSNYETVLSMYNDLAQGHAKSMAMYLCGTADFLEDPDRGLFSYGALRSRIEESRFEKGRGSVSGSVLRTRPLTVEEQEALLLRILELHQIANGYESSVTQDMVEEYMRDVRANSASVSPRILSRDFIGLLNVLMDDPDADFRSLVSGRAVEEDVGQTFRWRAIPSEPLNAGRRFPAMAINNSILDSVGNTPMVELRRISPKGTKVYAKLECLNPSGSIKDRIIKPIIEDAMSRGLLEEGGTIVEPTSGNTGISMAFICAAMGFKAVLAMPETMSKERVNFVRAYGAEIVLTPGSEGMDGSIRAARRIAEERGGFVPNQYDNPVNTEVHCATTGAEIIRDLPDLDAVFAGIGTGGTISGIGKAIKQAGIKAEAVGIQPAESPLLTGGKAAPHKIQGIGVNIVPKNYRKEYVDRIVDVHDDDAVAMALRLAREEAVFGGVSSGANVSAAVEYAESHPGCKVVAIIPDRGDRYFSTGMYDL